MPSAATLTVPFVTAMVCATPGVKFVPLMAVIVRLSPSISVSPFNGFSVNGVAASSAML